MESVVIDPKYSNERCPTTLIILLSSTGQTEHSLERGWALPEVDEEVTLLV